MATQKPRTIKLIERKTVPRKWIERLSDTPKFLFPSGPKGIGGYQNYVDKTKLPFNVLTSPSRNCTIPNWDRIVPDLGKTLLGQAYTADDGIIGNKQRFTNAGGIEMEARAWQSGTSKNDVIEVYFTNYSLLTGSVTGTFQVGETVTGSSSGVSGMISSIVGLLLTLTGMTGNFTVGETVTGSQSGATAAVVSAPTSQWFQITENSNPLARGLHEYYFDEWFDTKEASSIPNSVPGITMQRMIWVNGNSGIYSWTGGISIITGVTSSTISIPSDRTWQSQGFTVDGSGNAYVVVNGVSYQVNPAGLSTSTVTLTTGTTSGISVGNYAFSRIQSDATTVPFDVCRAYNGYMYYGNWNSKTLFQSNNFNRDYNYAVTNFQALDNDLTLDFASVFTGTTQQNYLITVTSVNPTVNSQVFTPAGTGGLNDGQFITSGYSGTAGATNAYTVSMVGDYTVVVNGLVTPTPIAGQSVTGGTSNANGRIVSVQSLGGNQVLGLALTTSNGFVNGETLTFSNGSTATVETTPSNATQYQNWIQLSKNGVVVPLSTSFGSISITPLVTSIIGAAQGMPDGLQMNFANYFGHSVGDTLTLTIEEGGADQFTWQQDGGTISSPIAMTGGIQTIGSNGVAFSFQGMNGHAVGDFWTITAYPAVSRAFANFYYNLNRIIGEGYQYTLPKNFWTMDTQEDSLYVNSTYGDWYQLTRTVTAASATTASETFAFAPLKQSGQNKVLFPYLTGHMNNEMVYVSANKTLDWIGRLIAVEKPQVSYLSDPVKDDFLASSFVGGRIQYKDKRLYISSPQQGVIHCWDSYRSYWQPIKQFPEVGLMSVIGDDLVAHSNIRNQSFTMFTNSNGDNGAVYTVVMRTPYHAPYGVWKSSFSNMSFTEGYVTGNPPLKHTVYLGVDGCGGILPHDIGFVICRAPDRSPFGEGSFGSHSFGSDMATVGSYAQEVYKAYSPVMQYYLISLEISCTAQNHPYSILSFGMNGMSSETGNNGLVNASNLAINNPQD